MPYKVPRTKCVMRPENWADQGRTRKELIAECKAAGESARHLSLSYPSWRRHKKAAKRYAMLIPPVGSFQRSVRNQQERWKLQAEMERAEQLMGWGG